MAREEDELQHFFILALNILRLRRQHLYYAISIFISNVEHVQQNVEIFFRLNC